MQERNTPTGVGKTMSQYTNLGEEWKHPHGRGEDGRPQFPKVFCSETPPRAWGRHVLLQSSNLRRGNTPTGVGKT